MARGGTSRRTSSREKFSRSNQLASNAVTSRSSKKTAGKQDEEEYEYIRITIPPVMMIWNERLIFTSEEVPASEEVFGSTAELYSVNFSLAPLLWNNGIAVTFCTLVEIVIRFFDTYLPVPICLSVIEV